MGKYLERLKNPGTILAIVACTVNIAVLCGYVIDSDKVQLVVASLCTILTLLGITNNPTTPGLDLPYFDEKTNTADPKDKK